MVTVIPTAKATQLTMNREGIRRLAAEELGKNITFCFCIYRGRISIRQFKELESHVVKPIMSSSVKDKVIRSEEDIQKAWNYAQEGGRAGQGKVIVEGFVDFDYEITQLTVRHSGGHPFVNQLVMSR